MLSVAKYQVIYGKWLKILTSKQMLQRLPIVHAQVKAGNSSEILLNIIRSYVLCIKRKKFLKKV